MGIVAELTLKGNELLLTDSLEAVPEIELSVEEDTAGESGLPIFYFWATGRDFDDFEAALAEDESVSEYTLLERLEDKRMYRVHCSRTSFYDAYRESAATFLGITASHRGWAMNMRFPTRESLFQYRKVFENTGVSFVLHRLYTDTEDPGKCYGLTDKQRDTLLLAHEKGYFSQPRETTLKALARELGISSQATSARLQRGIDTLVTATLVDASPVRDPI